MSIPRVRDCFSDKIIVDVFQRMENGEEMCIAQITDVNYEADSRETRIKYGDRQIVFRAAYDGPIFAYEDLCFDFFGEKQDIIARIHFLMQCKTAFIEYQGRKIFLQCDSTGAPLQPPNIKFMPYRIWGCANSSPTVMFDEIFRSDDIIKYKIIVNGALPMLLLMVIFSLPYTALLY